MLVLEYINVQEESVILEGRFAHAPGQSVDVIVGKDSMLIGKITHEDGETEVLSPNLCLRMAEILRPPNLVMRWLYLEGDGVRVKALFNWLKLSFELGVHEVTTEYASSYG